jgi:hypothetical protein
MTEFVLAGGCFWCLDSSFSQFKGIIDVECGYSGGHTQNPSYEAVCGEGTGHAEVAKVIFDENVISAVSFASKAKFKFPLESVNTKSLITKLAGAIGLGTPNNLTSLKELLPD